MHRALDECRSDGDCLMLKRLLEPAIIASAGVFLLWVGFGCLDAAAIRGALPMNSLLLVAGLMGIVGGEWFCWHGAARLISPPGWAGRIVNVVCAMFLGTLVMAGCIILIRIAEVS